MPRPCCPRRVGAGPAVSWFKPAGVPLEGLPEVVLALDELEALRLADLEGLYQETAAARMNVSRATFGRIVASARRKVAAALVEGHALRIEGGPVEVVEERTFACAACGATCSAPHGTPRPAECPACRGRALHRVDGGRGRGRRCGGCGGRNRGAK